MERSHYWLLKKMNLNFGTGCVWLIKGTADCCCEHGNERLGFQITQSISWLAEKMPAFGAGVCLMEFFWLLVNYTIIYFNCLRNRIRRRFKIWASRDWLGKEVGVKYWYRFISLLCCSLLLALRLPTVYSGTYPNTCEIWNSHLWLWKIWDVTPFNLVGRFLQNIGVFQTARSYIQKDSIKFGYKIMQNRRWYMWRNDVTSWNSVRWEFKKKFSRH